MTRDVVQMQLRHDVADTTECIEELTLLELDLLLGRKVLQHTATADAEMWTYGLNPMR